MSVIFPITYFLLSATFGGLVLEHLFLWLNRSVWTDDPSEVASDERFMAAWGLSLVQAVAMGLAIGAMNALLWVGMPLAIPPSPAAALIAEVTIVLLAIAMTTAPLGLALERILRQPLRRSVLLSAIYSAFFALATVATLIGLLIAMRRR